MKITLLGTGVAIPQADRFQSGLIVEGDTPVLFDCGCGVLQRIYQSGYKHTDISNVFLTHLHLDHCGDLLALIKANWLCDVISIQVYGPTGTRQWLDDLLAAYSYMQDKVDIQVTELTASQVVKVEGLEIECVKTIHMLPSLGFKVKTKGCSLLYTGDTEPGNEIIKACNGIDLLIHECSFPDSFDVTNHTTPKTLALKLEGVQVGKIILTHLYPQTRGFEPEMVHVVSDAGLCQVEIGYDLMVIEI